MNKHFLLSLGLLTIIGLSTPAIAFAQDAPNANITKRRPDRPANYSPTPIPSPTIQPAQVKQVETVKPSLLSQVWAKIKVFFQSFSK